jgi:hypothetical protein
MGIFRFPPPMKKWRQRYNWNIVEYGVKHHEPNEPTLILKLSYTYKEKNYPVSCLWP